MITTTAVRKGWVWLALCLVMAGLQFVRGAYLEAVIFTALPVLLIIDSTVLPNRRPGPDRRLPPTPVLAVIAVAVGIPLALVPRYDSPLAVIIGALGLVAVIAAWPQGRSPRIPAPGPALDRGGIAWAAICILACAFEVGAYLLSRVGTGAQIAFPAVSDLVGPLLDTDPGRLAFAAAWVAGGLALLRRGWRPATESARDAAGAGR